MLPFLIASFGSIVALVGWFGFKSVILLILGTVWYAVQIVIEWRTLNTVSKILPIVIFVIGYVVAAIFTSAPGYVGGMIAIAIYSLITIIVALICIRKSK